MHSDKTHVVDYKSYSDFPDLSSASSNQSRPVSSTQAVGLNFSPENKENAGRFRNPKGTKNKKGQKHSWQPLNIQFNGHSERFAQNKYYNARQHNYNFKQETSRYDMMKGPKKDLPDSQLPSKVRENIRQRQERQHTPDLPSPSKMSSPNLADQVEHPGGTVLIPVAPYFPKNLTESRPPLPVPTDLPSLLEALRRQIEYYFSEQNLTRDEYLRKRMNPDGFVEIAVIGAFPRVKKLTLDINLVADAIEDSDLLDVVDRHFVRPVINPLRWPLKPIDKIPASADIKHTEVPEIDLLAEQSKDVPEVDQADKALVQLPLQLEESPLPDGYISPPVQPQPCSSPTAQEFFIPTMQPTVSQGFVPQSLQLQPFDHPVPTEFVPKIPESFSLPESKEYASAEDELEAVDGSNTDSYETDNAYMPFHFNPCTYMFNYQQYMYPYQPQLVNMMGNLSMGSEATFPYEQYNSNNYLPQSS